MNKVHFCCVCHSEQLEFVRHISAVPGSDLYPDTGHSDCGISHFPKALASKNLDNVP
jgi:hypothetical protein